jgi:hypothetical protein
MCVTQLHEEGVMNTSYPTSPPSLDGQASTSAPAPCAEGTCHPAGLSGPAKTAAVTKVRCLEHELFEDGHVRAGITHKNAVEVIDELNQLRAALGWLEVDLDGRWRWPN